MFESVNVGDRVRLTGHGEVHEFTVIGASQHLLTSKHNVYDATRGWTVDILAPTEPTANGTLVTLFDASVWRERTIVRTGNQWTNINDAYAQYDWDTWVSDAKPGSVKVVYTHE